MAEPRPQLHIFRRVNSHGFMLPAQSVRCNGSLPPVDTRKQTVRSPPKRSHSAFAHSQPFAYLPVRKFVYVNLPGICWQTRTWIRITTHY